MLDALVVVQTGGIVLWLKRFNNSGDDLWLTECVAALLDAVFLSAVDQQQPSTFTFKATQMEWLLDNRSSVLYIAFYPKVLRLNHVQALLAAVRKRFQSVLDSTDESLWPRIDFDQDFTSISSQFDQRSSSSDLKTVSNNNITGNSVAKSSNPNAVTSSPNKKSAAKSDRKWGEKMAKKDASALDFSADKSSASETGGGGDSNQFIDPQALKRIQQSGRFDIQETEDNSDTAASATQSSFASRWFSALKNFASERELRKEDLKDIVKTLKEHLIAKNVAQIVAEKLCESVAACLVGKRVGAFTSVSNVVKESLEDAVRRILTPRTSNDILREINDSKSRGRPYVFTFVGVNGVGKSTNLSKVCFWLLQNNFSVLIAACDTFRSGAVEQLRTHVRNLQGIASNAKIELFERGYGKDAANIAKDAIAYARTQRYDVVLIDTAGRMQDNEPLMRALAKLVTVNNPDKILFVGEALVGNEAVDQLTKFNEALRNFSGVQNPRQIDGIILSKFDTIDDKVGAALSMTYITGQPILFVGVGQTYTDLRKVNIKQIASLLLK